MIRLERREQSPGWWELHGIFDGLIYVHRQDLEQLALDIQAELEGGSDVDTSPGNQAVDVPQRPSSGEVEVGGQMVLDLYPDEPVH